MKKIFCCLGLSLLCSTAQAEWIQYRITENGPSFYDPGTIAKMPDGKISMWDRFTRPQYKIDKIKDRDKRYIDYEYSLSKYIYDCQRQQSALSHIIDYTKDGKSLQSFSYLTELLFEDITPGSYGEILMRAACKEK